MNKQLTDRAFRMYSNRFRAPRHGKMLVLGALTACLTVLASADQADAIPVFARKYRTSCITCHAGFPKLNQVGEAFRRNGYQFPRGDFDLVKEEPVPLGTEAWKDMWPNAIWPSDIPHLPAVSLRGKLGLNTFLDTPTGAASPDFRFPTNFSLLSAATFGEDIAVWFSLEFEPEDEEVEVGIERAFVQFSNLFAWSQEDDEDGMRLGPRWLALPRHAMNLRVGQFEPQAIAPWASNHRRLGIAPRLTNVATVGGNNFQFEPAHRGFELNGVLRNYWSYAVGLVNGNSIRQASDNNSSKDVYFRVARKWWGYPLDGQVADVGAGGNGGPQVQPEVEVGMRNASVRGLPSPAIVRGQDSNGGSPGLEYWREMQFETGMFGYFGRNEAENDTPPPDAVPDDFQRVGFDARWQRQDFDIFGAALWGWDDNPGNGNEEELFAWFIEANYYFKPWMIGYLRYEMLDFQTDLEDGEIARLAPGIVFYVRANLRIVAEALVDTRGNDTTADSIQFLMDFAY